MPAGLRLCKRIVVQILVFGDFSFKGDILADMNFSLINIGKGFNNTGVFHFTICKKPSRKG